MQFLNFKFLFLIVLNLNFFVKMLECMRLFGADIEATAPNDKEIERPKENQQEIVPKSAERLYLRRRQFWPQNEPPPNLRIDLPLNQMVEKLKKEERKRVEKEKAAKGEEKIVEKMPKTLDKCKEKIVEKMPKLTQRRNKSENERKVKGKIEQKSAIIQIGQKQGRKKMKMRSWEELGYRNEEEGEGGMPMENAEEAVKEETKGSMPLKIADEGSGRQNSDLRRSSRVPIVRKIFDPSRPSRVPKAKKQKKTFNPSRANSTDRVLKAKKIFDPSDRG